MLMKIGFLFFILVIINYMKKMLKFFQLYFLFHLGAFSDLEYCELHVEETYVTNTESEKM